ncbi:hypothetical protein DFH07DRAFT_1063468 [Mycena maculata]|uniref:Uncharacterized protein n=1 Tax=Mycena maculata TaxID=230809 RepID=A0AAD7N4J3_9AGAR|nr:hypothetical protein DFH07DRAFT_1063468 [Mycena maculata]
MDFLRGYHHEHEHHDYNAGAVPASGFRIKLSTNVPLQRHEVERAGPPPCNDLDGSSIYVGSAIFTHEDGRPKHVQPGKVGHHLNPPCHVPYGGREIGHHGRYDILIIDHAMMEWVHTSHGRIPEGRTPVEGGYEENGDRLYHAIAHVDGVRVPGKTGHHLGSAHVAFGGQEREIHENYEILCWRRRDF